MQRLSSLFTKERPAPTNRFETLPELRGINDYLIKMRDKYRSLRDIAETKGAQSEEFAVSTILKFYLDIAENEIEKYNSQSPKEDKFEELHDAMELAASIKARSIISKDDETKLNNAQSDTHYIRNLSMIGLLLTMPAIPLMIFGGTFIGISSAICGFFLMKPVHEALELAKAIDKDPITKKLLEQYLDCLEKTYDNLKHFLPTPKESPRP